MFYSDIVFKEGVIIGLPLFIKDIHFLNTNLPPEAKVMLTFPNAIKDVPIHYKMNFIRIFSNSLASISKLRECHIIENFIKSNIIDFAFPQEYIASDSDEYIAFFNKRKITKNWIQSTNSRRENLGLRKTKKLLDNEVGLFYIPMTSSSNKNNFSLFIDIQKNNKLVINEVSSYGLSRNNNEMTFLPIFQ